LVQTLPLLLLFFRPVAPFLFPSFSLVTAAITLHFMTPETSVPALQAVLSPHSVCCPNTVESMYSLPSPFPQFFWNVVRFSHFTQTSRNPDLSPGFSFLFTVPGFFPTGKLLRCSLSRDLPGWQHFPRFSCPIRGKAPLPHDPVARNAICDPPQSQILDGQIIIHGSSPPSRASFWVPASTSSACFSSKNVALIPSFPCLCFFFNRVRFY